MNQWENYQGTLTHWPALIVMCLIFTLVSACGFQLRGSVELPKDLQSIAIQGTPTYGDIGIAVTNALRRAGGQLTEANVADAILVITQDESNQRVLSVDEFGKANAYILTYTLGFRLDSPAGDVKVKTQRLSSQRQYRFSSSDILAKDDEVVRIVREMRNNAVDQMLRRLVKQINTEVNVDDSSTDGKSHETES